MPDDEITDGVTVAPDRDTLQAIMQWSNDAGGVLNETQIDSLWQFLASGVLGIPAVQRTADRETIYKAIYGTGTVDDATDAVLAVLVPADQVRAEALEAEADRVRAIAKDAAEAQRASDLEEGLPLVGTSTANEVEWYQMGNWAEGLLRARAAEYRKAASA